MSDNTYSVPGLVAPAPGPAELLMVWDAPNLDMGLGAILGSRPSSNQRPRFDAIGRWLLDYTDELSEKLDIRIETEATVFTNVAQGGAEAIRSWVDALRNVGYAVFAKPKNTEESDVDPDMIAHIRRRQEEGVLKGLVVASADGQNFQDTLEDLAMTGVAVTVIGFHEQSAWAIASTRITFIDLEEIPGVFREPLPRLNLDSLPADGAWLQPFRSLHALR
ncbi:MAG: NYN domain-containing protein [Corynebacterium sp.]|nr:NYN domain-containing protein [Corynebacterium sp.]